MKIILPCLLVLNFAIYSCKNKGIETESFKPDTLLIEPASINNNFIDSGFVESFFNRYPLLNDEVNRVFKFYRKRNFQFAWFNNNGLNEQAHLFINLINNYHHEGIADSIPYDSLMNTWYLSLADSIKKNDSLYVKFEVLLTAEFFKYAQRIWGGIPEEKTKDLDWYIKRKRLPYVALLDSMLTDPRFFASNKPVYKQYDLLKSNLEKYHDLEASVRWDSVPFTKKNYKPGDEDSVLILVKKKLFLLGDFISADTLTIVYNEALKSAVNSFQERHGLEPTGNIGTQTMAELNVPVQKRIEQLIINMERCRWVPLQPKGDFIIVNIPEFTMHVYKNDTLAWNSNVVVGNNANQTVIFNGDIKYVVLSPYWNIPLGILGNEILPACKKNPAYLAAHNMEVVGASGKSIDPYKIEWAKYTAKNFPYTIWQKPGKNNSLGLAKFLFPNEYSIYLHDTPAKSLFNESKRNFSHGCIRVSEPQKLAEFLLKNNPEWDAEKINTTMLGGKEVYITLDKTVPVFIGYLTAFVDAKGKLNFRNDVYGHDKRLAETLFKN